MMRKIQIAAVAALCALTTPAFCVGQAHVDVRAALQQNYNRIAKNMVEKQIKGLYKQLKSLTTRSFHYTMQTGKQLDLTAFLHSLSKGVADTRQSGKVSTQIASVSIQSDTVMVKGLTHVSMQVADSVVPTRSHTFDSIETREDTWKLVNGTWKLEEMKVLKTDHFVDKIPTVSALL